MKSGFFSSRSSMIRDMKICGHDQPTRIKLRESPTYRLDPVNVCMNAGITVSELAKDMANCINPPLRMMSLLFLLSSDLSCSVFSVISKTQERRVQKL